MVPVVQPCSTWKYWVYILKSSSVCKSGFLLKMHHILLCVQESNDLGDSSFPDGENSAWGGSPWIPELPLDSPWEGVGG